MAIQLINVGSAPNDGTGDTPRAAGQKLNSNFSDSSNAASKMIVSSATDTTADRVLTTGYSAKELSDVTPDAINGSVVQRGALGSADEGTFKVGAPTDPAHPALFGGVSILQTSSSSVTAETPTSYGMVTLDYTGATGTITLPTDAPTGGRILIKKRNSTMGAVNINAGGTDDVQWGSAQLRLYSDGDYWLLLWDGARWCLLAGYETGRTADGSWCRGADGVQICFARILGFFGTTNFTSEELGTWTFPTPFSEIPSLNISVEYSVNNTRPVVANPVNGTSSVESQTFKAKNIDDGRGTSTASWPVSLSASGYWH